MGMDIEMVEDDGAPPYLILVLINRIERWPPTNV